MSESSDEDQMEFEVASNELHVVLTELSSVRAWLDPEFRVHNGDLAISAEAFYRLLGTFHQPPLHKHRPADLDLSLVPEDKFHSFFKEAISRAHTLCALFAASTRCLRKDVWLQPEHINDTLLAMDSTQLAIEVTLHLEVLGELANSWATSRDSMSAGDSIDLRESVKEIWESMVAVESDSLEAWKEIGFDFCCEASELIEQGLASPAMITAMLKELERTSDNDTSGAASEMARQSKKKRVTGRLRLRVVCERDIRRKLAAHWKKLKQRINARNEQRSWSLEENDDGDENTVDVVSGNSPHSGEGTSGEEVAEKSGVHGEEAPKLPLVSDSTGNDAHSSVETGDQTGEATVQATAVITQPPQSLISIPSGDPPVLSPFAALHTSFPVAAPSDEEFAPESRAQVDNSSEIKDLEEREIIEDDASEEETEGELESEEGETETDEEITTDYSVEAMPAQRRDIPSSVNTEDAVENGADDWQRQSVAMSTGDEEEKMEDDEEKESSGETVFGEEKEEETQPVEKEASAPDSGARADEESKQASKLPSPSFHFYPSSAIAETEEIPKTNYLQQLFDECGIAKKETEKEGREEKDTVEEKETTVVTEEAALDGKDEESGEVTQAFEGERDASEVVSQGKKTAPRDVADYCTPAAKIKDASDGSNEEEKPPTLGCETEFSSVADNGKSGAAINGEVESAEKIEASEMARQRKRKRVTGRLRLRVICERNFRRKLARYLKKLKKRIDARKERSSWSLEENGQEAESAEKMEASEMARQRKMKRVTGRLRLRVICERDFRRKLVAYWMKLKHKEQRSWLLEENDDEDATSVQVIHGNSSHSDVRKYGEEAPEKSFAHEKSVVHSDEAPSTRNDARSSGETGDETGEASVQATAVIAHPPQPLMPSEARVLSPFTALHTPSAVAAPSDEWIAPVSAQFDNSSETIQNRPRRGAIYGRGGMVGQRQESAAAAPAGQPRDERASESRGFGQRGFGQGVARSGRGGMTMLQPRGDERENQNGSNGGSQGGNGARRGAIYGLGGGMGGQSQDSRDERASRGFGNPVAARGRGVGSFGQPLGQQASFGRGGSSQNHGLGFQSQNSDGFGGHEERGFGRGGGTMRRPQQEHEGANQNRAQGRGRGSRGFGQAANYGRGGIMGGEHQENLPHDEREASQNRGFGSQSQNSDGFGGHEARGFGRGGGTMRRPQQELEGVNQNRAQGRGRGSRGFGQAANYGRGGMMGGQHQENLPHDEHFNLVFNRSDINFPTRTAEGRSRKNSDEIWQ